MNLEYVHEFVILVRNGKFQEAADEMYISQPTLSKHILALEKELGQPLLLRSKGRALTLTAFGERFLPYALKLSGTWNEMKDDILSAKEEKKITIGTSPVVPLYSLFRFFDSFLQRHSSYSLQVIDSAQSDLYGLLRKGRCSLIITQRDPAAAPSPDEIHIPYKTDTLSVLLPHHHPLAGQASVHLSELSRERFVLVEGSGMQELLVSCGCVQHDAVKVGRVDAMIDLVANGTGISVLPSAPARHFSHDLVAIVPAAPEITIEYDLVFSASYQSDPVIIELLDWLK